MVTNPLPVWFRRLLLLDAMLDRGMYRRRACGDCVCEVCGRLYYDHRRYLPGLTLLCNGVLAHL